MFYRLENNKVAESFDILPVFHQDIMDTIIESEVIPDQYSIWNGTTFVSEFTDPELLQKQKDFKYIEVNNYADVLIEDAYSNPVQDIISDPIEHRNIISVRRNNKSDKIAGEIVLTQEEKDEAKTDQKLSEYEQKILTDSSKVKENIDKLNTVQEVIDFNISAENWNVWTPPV